MWGYTNESPGSLDAQKSIHVGRYFIGLQNGQVVFIETACGRTFKMYHSQDCCESVYICDVVGDVSDLIDTPILILTTESSDQMKQAGRAAGATGWLVKPFDPNRLIEVIQKVIR